MICEGCGESGWFKTVRWKGGTRRFVLCNDCYGTLGGVDERFLIVYGAVNVASRCSSCGHYVHPLEIDPATAVVGGHGKRDVVSTGLCRECSDHHT